MFSRATLLLLSALPALAGMAGGEVVSVVTGAAAPAFVPHQQTLVVAPLGHAASLDCTVYRLLDKSVSWVRSRDLQILSHAGVVFTADARVSATSGVEGAGSSRHSLRIERLRASDAGRYECQVNTEPKMSLFFNLTVVDEPVPTVVVSAVGPSTVLGVEGGAATLACEARYEPPPRQLPLAALEVRWHRGDELINLQSSRGGVSLDTERWAARSLSRLTLAELGAPDAGEYVCAAAGRAAALRLRVQRPTEMSAEAMQRDEGEPAPGRAAPPAAAAPPALLLLVLAAGVR
ncbi:unnamed protein product [Arctia plantaginis]|uniref:Ig-like domain-containing protein n=1 Tax=Arctia plantaginis TaxID=874455 RepID=A0A8S1BEH3_ARCPL|nr:unnamed protein product [Arctia plantaginis]CAB3260451.1 unnamed protein product [Arctia plantaginis]